MYATSGLGATLVIMSVVSIWLVNRIGRKILLLFGLTVMGVSSVAIVLLNEFQ
ncbi:facilitated glucose transporter protein 1, partial [Elysia marginata]